MAKLTFNDQLWFWLMGYQIVQVPRQHNLWFLLFRVNKGLSCRCWQMAADSIFCDHKKYWVNFHQIFTIECRYHKKYLVNFLKIFDEKIWVIVKNIRWSSDGLIIIELFCNDDTRQFRKVIWLHTFYGHKKSSLEIFLSAHWNQLFCFLFLIKNHERSYKIVSQVVIIQSNII